MIGNGHPPSELRLSSYADWFEGLLPLRSHLQRRPQQRCSMRSAPGFERRQLYQQFGRVSVSVHSRDSPRAEDAGKRVRLSGQLDSEEELGGNGDGERCSAPCSSRRPFLALTLVLVILSSLLLIGGIVGVVHPHLGKICPSRVELVELLNEHVHNRNMQAKTRLGLDPRIATPKSRSTLRLHISMGVDGCRARALKSTFVDK